MMQAKRVTTLKLFVISLVGALALLASAGVGQALANVPHWDVVARTAPRSLQPGKPGRITAYIVNLGDAPAIGTTSNPIVITDRLPAAVEAVGAMKAHGAVGTESPNGEFKGQSYVTATCVDLRCTYVGEVPPFVAILAEAEVSVKAGAFGVIGENEMTVEGGNVPSRTSKQPLEAGAAEPQFGVERYELTPEEEDGAVDRQAGTHPFQLTTTLLFNQTFAVPEANSGYGRLAGTPELLKTLHTTLPAGLIADTTAVPECSDVDFSTIRSGDSNLCPADTAIGVAVVAFQEPIYKPAALESVPVFNLEPAQGEPARFGFDFDEVPVSLETKIKTGEGYAAEVTASYTSQVAEVMGTILTIWGVPGDERHHEARGWACLGQGHYVLRTYSEECPPITSGTESPAYLSLPTTCGTGTMASTLLAESWVPGEEAKGATNTDEQIRADHAAGDTSGEAEATATEQTLDDCGQLPLNPKINVQPDQGAASTPSGLNVEVQVPQETTVHAGTSPDEADIKETTMALPEGLQVNPGSADGLGTCGVTEAGFLNAGGAPAANSDSGGALESEFAAQRFTPGASACPENSGTGEVPSRLGEVTIETPLLKNALKGYVYLGQQDTNPFTSPLALYLMAENAESGVRVKLVGEIRISESGQIVSVFKGTPPVPFSSLKVHLFDGPRATETTPAYCHPYETTASFVPSSGEAAAQASSSFTPTTGPNGTPCQASGALPFTPSQQAGVTNNQAGGFSPFTLSISRPDGDQALKSITTQLPPGAAALIASVTPCPEPQAALGTCGPESEIGHSSASSGLGSDPFTLPGAVYLTGPYDGAPFGLSAVTNAENVGPFDVGTIVVRSSININKYTAAATIDTDAAQFFAKSGETKSFEGLPNILKGAPAQIKQLNVTIDRPGFEFNPTNCSPMQVTGTLSGYEGGSEPVSTPFEVSNCASLPFAPKLTATTGAHGSKVDGSSFDVTIESAGLGQAGIHKLDLTLPEALPSRLTTIQKACLASVFEANPAGCEEGSVVGEGIVHTPVFKNPLRGPAYLVSHGNAAFPDVEFVLQGEGVLLVLDGKTDIKKGVTYSKFETNPDAPFTKFESIFPTGPHSALTVDTKISADYDLCGKTLNMPIEITGQNGAFKKLTTKIGVMGCGGVKSYKVTKAQLLAKALKACKKYKKKSKRLACEKAAHKKYGPKHKTKKKSAKKK